MIGCIHGDYAGAYGQESAEGASSIPDRAACMPTAQRPAIEF